MVRTYLAAVLAAALWGVSFLLTKVILTQMGPMTAAAVRWWIASLALLALVAVRGSGRGALQRAWRREWVRFVGLGAVGVGLFYILQNAALVYTTSVDVGLIMNMVPVLTTMMGVWLLGEQFNRRAVGGLIAATLGVTLISLGGLDGVLAEATHSRLLGSLMAFGAAVAGAVYMIGGKRVVSTYGPLTVTILSGLLGAVILTPAAAWEGGSLALSVPVWAALLGLALGSGAAAYWLYWYAAERLPISRVSVFIYVTPVVSTVLGVAVLGEPMSLATGAGAACVLGGIMLVQG